MPFSTKKSSNELSERNRIFAGLAAEVAFAMLPLIVVAIVVLNADHSAGLFASPEWTFGAAILFGQTLVKFVSGLAQGGDASKGPVALAVSLLMVFGLAPSLLVLLITLQIVEEGNVPPHWLQATQVLLFAGATLVYMLLGTIGELWRKT